MVAAKARRRRSRDVAELERASERAMDAAAYRLDNRFRVVTGGMGVVMMRRSDLVRHDEKHQTERTTQIVFGERQHLLRVLDSLETTEIPPVRFDQERRAIEQLIFARTQELNAVNEDWDEKVGFILSADVKPDVLERLSREAPEEDYYLLRLISEHPRVPAKTLGRLAKHPYGAIRENVARHPNTDPATLGLLAKDKSQPLWYLVAFNPNTPAALRRKLQERLRKLGQSNGSK